MTLAVNVPGPVAGARLAALGAAVTKVEPPGGDPLELASPSWYRELAAAQEVVTLDLKTEEGGAGLERLLSGADLLLTSHRPAALARLGLAWEGLHERHPRLVQVAIVGHPAPNQHLAGHDLTYVAPRGLLRPPHLLPTLLADLGGAQLAVEAGLALLLARERGAGAGYAEVPLSDAADFFAEPLRHGLSAPGGALGGGLPQYNLYEARDGWVAVAALEPHFLRGLQEALGLEEPTREALSEAFASRTAQEWEEWGAAHDLPVAAVRPDRGRCRLNPKLLP